MAKKKNIDGKNGTTPNKIRRKRGAADDEEKGKQKTNLVVLPTNRKATASSKSDKAKAASDKKEPAYKVEVQDFLVQEIPDDKDRTTLGIKDAARAIIQADGYITRAARILKLNYATLKKLIEKTPSLKALLTEVIESTNDLAESKLKQQIAAGNLAAIIFQLKCKARHRGWIEDADKASQFKEQKPITFSYQLVKDRKDVEELQKAQERLQKERSAAQ